MPRLSVLAACENILLDDDQNPTLVGVFTALDARNETGAEIPHNATSPRVWFIMSMWLASASDIGKTFTQKLKIITPDGKEFGHGSEELVMLKRSHTGKIKVVGLPIGVEGNIVVKIWLEVLNTPVTDVHEFWIDIRHPKVR